MKFVKINGVSYPAQVVPHIPKYYLPKPHLVRQKYPETVVLQCFVDAERVTQIQAEYLRYTGNVMLAARQAPFDDIFLGTPVSHGSRTQPVDLHIPISSCEPRGSLLFAPFLVRIGAHLTAKQALPLILQSIATQAKGLLAGDAPSDPSTRWLQWTSESLEHLIALCVAQLQALDDKLAGGPVPPGPRFVGSSSVVPDAPPIIGLRQCDAFGKLRRPASSATLAEPTSIQSVSLTTPSHKRGRRLSNVSFLTAHRAELNQPHEIDTDTVLGDVLSPPFAVQLAVDLAKAREHIIRSHMAAKVARDAEVAVRSFRRDKLVADISASRERAETDALAGSVARDQRLRREMAASRATSLMEVDQWRREKASLALRARLDRTRAEGLERERVASQFIRDRLTQVASAIVALENQFEVSVALVLEAELTERGSITDLITGRTADIAKRARVRRRLHELHSTDMYK
jgi:hypothetical protein